MPAIPWRQFARLVAPTVRTVLRNAPKAIRSRTSDYPGDYEGLPQMEYRPRRDGLPQPGEIVWTWVPYEEDYSKGKDRPVLLIAEEPHYLLGLPLTSKDHDVDEDQERRAGRYWMDIGSGEWDSKGRESEARLDRIVRISKAKVRRVAGQLDEAIFQEVAKGVQLHWDD